MNSYFPRGSEWRKWDLQVHTPESIVIIIPVRIHGLNLLSSLSV